MEQESGIGQRVGMDVRVHKAGKDPPARCVEDTGTLYDGGNGLARFVAATDGSHFAAVENHDAVSHGVAGLGVDHRSAFDDQGLGGEGLARVVRARIGVVGQGRGSRVHLGGEPGYRYSCQRGSSGEDSAAGQLTFWRGC
ncbi:hypothetical protein AAHB34_05190 [Paenarthrobacter ureafaciens]